MIMAAGEFDEQSVFVPRLKKGDICTSILFYTNFFLFFTQKIFPFLHVNFSFLYTNFLQFVAFFYTNFEKNAVKSKTLV